MSGSTTTSARRGVGFWCAVVVGWLVVVIATKDYIAVHGTADAIRVAAWLVGGNAVHDALLVPIALLIGTVLARFVNEPWRTPLRSALVASACVILVAIPVLGGYGRKAANPSLLPLDYDSAVLTALGIVAALAAAWLALRLLRRQAS